MLLEQRRSSGQRALEVVGDELDDLLAGDVLCDSAIEVPLECRADPRARAMEQHPLVALGHLQRVADFLRVQPWTSRSVITGAAPGSSSIAAVTTRRVSRPRSASSGSGASPRG